MGKKPRKIIQCPYCDSNRLYFRRGLVADVLISLLIPVRSYTCGSCSRSFRKFGNYFTSKQALIHIFGALAILAIINPQLLLPENWLLEKQQEAEVQPESYIGENQELYPEDESELPLLSRAVANSTNNTVIIVGNGTALLAANATQNATHGNETSRTILSFNSTEFANATDQASTEESIQTSKEDEDNHGLQEGKLKSIYFRDVDGKTRINLDLGGAPLSYTSFFLRNPDRLVVDIHGKWDYFGPTVLKPENPIFSKFRIGIYDDKIRMVMDLKGQTPSPVITKTPNGLNIDVK